MDHHQKTADGGQEHGFLAFPSGFHGQEPLHGLLVSPKGRHGAKKSVQSRQHKEIGIGEEAPQEGSRVRMPTAPVPS